MTQACFYFFKIWSKRGSESTPFDIGILKNQGKRNEKKTGLQGQGKTSKTTKLQKRRKKQQAKEHRIKKTTFLSINFLFSVFLLLFDIIAI